jgi:hypothetical protein|tara:strand:+ start:1528 stop:1734 length:207 start_codon:yes stop_codon:yes gene_type:complete
MLKEAIELTQTITCCESECVNQWSWHELRIAQQVMISLADEHFQVADMSLGKMVDFITELMQEGQKSK